MTSILAVIVVLGGLIFFHELGHFLMARALGIGVHVFSLGFGPKLLSWRPGATEYRLSLIPLGGYVQLAGEKENADDATPRENQFAQRPPWQRMLVVLAGPLSNFFLAWLIFWGLLATQGMEELLPVIGKVTAESPAAAAGLAPQDRILAIDGKTIRTWDDLVTAIEASDGRALTLSIRRQEILLEVRATPQVQEKRTIFGEMRRAPMLGIAPAGATERRMLSVPEAAWEGLRHIGQVTSLMLQGIIKLIERVIPWSDVGGVILITELIHREAQSGLVQLLALTALISVNLGVLNLLPIPVLDGGHILFYLLETIAGRPLPAKVQEVALRIGMALLITLMILATVNDILRHIP
ncbi:zinc metalloprotease [Thermodesulfomicrobium sp. WS]|uniref:RIP metalloprotease RseP n=1 Tax=Thermodesulfomicrobium sp. WS TaxID=3004129 RepID=UPI00249126D6|nr:RIP metalloprotease RseP [Thermodesulfomicrobium sp. WS]BDV00310.1 zinc metalloprotease [Thermodesulfomicrobium sp. WS]